MGSLILVRHSITEASAGGRNLGQQSDPPLTPEGLALASRLAITLAAELDELPHDELRLLSSTALRCRQTADALATGLGREAEEVEHSRALLELDYGGWDGLTAEECRARDPDLRAAWEADPFETRCPDGESGSDVAQRAFAALALVESWLSESRSRAALVVAHNHVNRLRLCALFGWPMREYRDRLEQDPGGYSIIGLGSGQAVIRRVNAAPQ
jgi:probable phosphoglycerate mutase